MTGFVALCRRLRLYHHIAHRNTYLEHRAAEQESIALARSFAQKAAKGLSDESRRRHLQMVVKTDGRRP